MLQHLLILEPIILFSIIFSIWFSLNDLEKRAYYFFRKRYPVTTRHGPIIVMQVVKLVPNVKAASIVLIVTGLAIMTDNER